MKKIYSFLFQKHDIGFMRFSRVRYHLNFAGVGWCLCHSSLHWLFREMLKAGTEFANQYSSIGVGTAAFNICGMMLKALKPLQHLDFM